MKLIIILITIVGLQVSARGYARNVRLSFRDAPLDHLFIEILKQTGYDFHIRMR